jgi:invasion protein IalB
MPTTKHLILTAAFLCLGTTGALFAQETTPPPPAEGTTPDAGVDAPAETPVEPAPDAAPADGADVLSLGTPEGAAADGPGSVYVQDKFELWELRCIKAADGSDPCQLYQLLKDAKNNPVAEISLFPLPEGQEAVVGATFVAPLGTLLTEQVRLSVDGAKGKVYPFSWCEQIGCYARIGLTAAEVDGFKKGAAVGATIVPVGAPDQKVNLSISLKGFTAAYDALVASAKPN